MNYAPCSMPSSATSVAIGIRPPFAIEHAGLSRVTLPEAYTNALRWLKEVSLGGDACVAPT